MSKSHNKLLLSLQCISVTHHLQTFPHGETPLQNCLCSSQLLYPYLYILVKYKNSQSMKHNLQIIPPRQQQNLQRGTTPLNSTLSPSYIVGDQINKVILTQPH